MLYDSSLVSQTCDRGDITVRAVGAARMAEDNGVKGLANMILVGAILSAMQGIEPALIESAMLKTVTDRKKEMIDNNIKAVMLGLEYKS
jgi:2-oxoglutarate ferredoxin oxidoreductase subunit gamma